MFCQGDAGMRLDRVIGLANWAKLPCFRHDLLEKLENKTFPEG
jgi:hypothetical protein